jgi:hypothetical protein
MSNEFPYGNDLAKVKDWIGRFESRSNNWHIQFLGGANSMDDCELHFLLHGMDSLTSAHAVLTGSGLSLPITPKGFDIPRTGRDVRKMISEEIREDHEQALDGTIMESNLSKPFLDNYAQSNVWKSCYNLEEEKQYMTRWTRNAFSLSDLSKTETEVNIVSGSVVIFEMMSIDFHLPGDESEGFTPTKMSSAESGLSTPGLTYGKYNCKWQIRSWKDNFYSRCPYRKGGDRGRFTGNRFLHYLPPYTGYLYRTREDYLRAFPQKDYPFWQDLFPQLNESVEHFMGDKWAGSDGGWIDDVPWSYIEEYGP